MKKNDLIQAVQQTRTLLTLAKKILEDVRFVKNSPNVYRSWQLVKQLEGVLNILLQPGWVVEQDPLDPSPYPYGVMPEALDVVIEDIGSYTLIRSERNGMGIFCKRCGRTSYSQGDIDNRYCGNCKEFHQKD